MIVMICAKGKEVHWPHNLHEYLEALYVKLTIDVVDDLMSYFVHKRDKRKNKS